MEVAIRADGSHDVGYGHLVRSGTLADELIDRGHEVRYLTRTPESVENICPDDVRYREIGGNWDEEGALSEGKLETVVITDSHDIGLQEQRRIKSQTQVLATVIDDARHSISADIVVNDNIYAEDINYDWIQEEPCWCLGLNYALLRKQFQEIAQRDVSFRNPPARVIVMMGGSDKENRTPGIIQALSDMDMTATVVVGPGFENLSEIRTAASRSRAAVELRETPSNLASLMADADIAVSTLGTTTYELMATQVPIIGIPDNTTPISSALTERALAWVLPRNPTIDEIKAAVNELVSDTERRQTLHDRYGEIITGQGPAKVIDAIEACYQQSTSHS